MMMMQMMMKANAGGAGGGAQPPVSKIEIKTKHAYIFLIVFFMFQKEFKLFFVTSGVPFLHLKISKILQSFQHTDLAHINS